MSFSKNNCLTKASCDAAIAKLQSEQSVDEYCLNQGKFVLKLPPNLQRMLPRDSVILDSIDLEFKCAANHITQQNVIGVSFDGHEISRIGKLFWICIATECCVFLFDIQALGRSAFDHSLKNIFQSENIVKVIYDSRRPSDCLYHLFSTTLVNAFDVQVADLICQQNCGFKSSVKNVISLDRCLVNYLSVPNEFLFDRIEINGNFFSKRPLDNQCRNLLLKNSLYLIILYEKLKKLMLNSVYKASEFYLKAVSDIPKLTLEQSVISVTPPALQKQGLEIVTPQKGFSKQSSFTTITTELRHSQNADKNYCSDEIVLNSKLGCKSKYSLSTCVPRTLETLSEDIMQKCSIVRKELLYGKIHDCEKFKNSPNKMTFREQLQNQPKAPLYDSTSKTDDNKAYLKKYATKKCLVNNTATETKTYRKLCPQNKLSGDNAKAFKITNNSVTDYSYTWEKLRSYCGTSNDISMSVKNSKIKIIPSGMNC